MCHIIDYVNFDHWVKIEAVDFFSCIVNMFPFVIKIYFKGWVRWLTPVIQARREAQVGGCGPAQPWTTLYPKTKVKQGLGVWLLW
jgi:hypothetical protein